jgi:hypothetical protein
MRGLELGPDCALQLIKSKLLFNPVERKNKTRAERLALHYPRFLSVSPTTYLWRVRLAPLGRSWRFLALSLRQKWINYVRMIQSPSGDWRPFYEAALSETDVTKLPQRITAARGAILDRIEEGFTHSLPGEHRAMDDALRNLGRLAQSTTSRAA